MQPGRRMEAIEDLNAPEGESEHSQKGDTTDARAQTDLSNKLKALD